MKAVHRVRQTGQASIERTCNCFDMHRDAYYKYQMRYQQRKTVESKVIELVNRERIEQPRTGTRKLYKTLRDTFDALGIKSRQRLPA